MAKLEMPMPKIPEIEPAFETEEASEEFYEEEETSGFKSEAVINAVAKLIGFISTIGLPMEVKAVKTQEYAELAIQTGLAESLVDVIDQYLPDFADRPEYAVLVAAIAYGTFVMADRASIKAKYEEKKNPPVPKDRETREKVKQAEEEKRRKQIEAVLEHNEKSSGGGADVN